MRIPLVACAAAGCATMSGARPLPPGEHAVGLTFGGALVELGGPIPLPNAVLEGRSGVAEIAERPLDLNYGVNATALAFGLLQGHLGASWLLAEQGGARPALAVTNRLFFATNLPGLPYKPEPRLQGWAADQIELDASWALGHHLLYLGLAQYTDLRAPSWIPTPLVGAALDPGAPGGVGLHGEVRWFAFGQGQDLNTMVFFPDDRGALAVSLGGSYRF